MPPSPTRSVAQAQEALRTLATAWSGSELKERQAFQTWFLGFCDALGVERPGPKGAGDYCFELPRRMVRTDDSETTGFIDCWKAGHVAVESTECFWSGANFLGWNSVIQGSATKDYGSILRNLGF